MRPPVIDGIEEHDPTGRIEEHDFLESGPHDREPPVSSRTRRGMTVHKPRRGPSIWTVDLSHTGPQTGRRPRRATRERPVRGIHGRYTTVRPRLRARGFGRRAGRQGQRWSTGLPGCLARTRSSRCSGGTESSGWRGCPTPPVSHRSSR